MKNVAFCPNRDTALRRVGLGSLFAMAQLFAPAVTGALNSLLQARATLIADPGDRFNGSSSSSSSSSSSRDSSSPFVSAILPTGRYGTLPSGPLLDLELNGSIGDGASGSVSALDDRVTEDLAGYRPSMQWTVQLTILIAAIAAALLVFDTIMLCCSDCIRAKPARGDGDPEGDAEATGMATAAAGTPEAPPARGPNPRRWLILALLQATGSVPACFLL